MAWTTSVDRSAATNINGLDNQAALDLARVIDISHFRASEVQPLIPIVVRIDEEKDDASQLVGQLDKAGVINISSWYLTETAGFGEDRFGYPKPGSPFVAYASIEFFQYLASTLDPVNNKDIPDNLEPLIKAVKQIEIRSPISKTELSITTSSESEVLLKSEKVVNEPAPSQADDAVQQALTANDKVIMAVIDDGIAIANTRFQNNSGTRVEYFWAQSATDTAVDIETLDDLSKAEIDDLLQVQSTVGGIVDEDLFYHKAGLLPTAGAFEENQLTKRGTHGTHVLDMAAGYAKEDNVLNRPIVAVQLPSHIVKDTSGRAEDGERDYRVLEALEYILNRADKLSVSESQLLPLVINFSFGTYSGPHDGTSLLEQRIDEIINNRANTWVVLPAGNSRQTRTHSHITKETFNQSQSVVNLNWRVQPDDLTESHLHIWMSAGDATRAAVSDQIKISVTAPDGSVSPHLGDALPEGYLEYRVKDTDTDPVCFVRSGFKGGSTNRSYFRLRLSPTAYNDNIGLNAGAFPKPAAPAGNWKISIEDINFSEDAEINCWIERDDTPLGYRPRGRQSYFDDPQQERFAENTRPYRFDVPGSLSTTKRSHTLNSLATGTKPIVVGAMYRKEQQVTDYSSCGPACVPFGQDKPSREGPDVLAVADDSRVHTGIAGAGTRSGSVVYLNGSSVAAPQVAREVANLISSDVLTDGNGRQELASILEGAAPLQVTSTRGGDRCSDTPRWLSAHPHSPKDRIEPEPARQKVLT